MRNRFTVDFIERQIIGTKTSFINAQHHGSKEYDELHKLIKAHPQFELITKAVKKSKNKNTYKNLSFTFIEKYISSQPRSLELMQEYGLIKRIASSLGMSVYPYTKRWFLKKFSDKDGLFDMQAAEELINAGLAAAQVEELIAKDEESTETQADAVTQAEESAMPQIEAAA